MKDFIDAGISDGDILPHSWLEERFGMKALDDDDVLTPAAFQDRQFAWLRNLEAFRAQLLEKHQIFLQSVHGRGYRVVPAREQTAAAQEKFEREATKAFRRAATTLKNVRLDELSDTERKENTDAIAKLSMLRGMQRGALE
ncbi:hypothetical protein [Cupriavidus sp. USMAA2-4]|uniref:hypothetical protein n=1 Tax=Cupriavidus sp. USMAA2-4 TaxID=876364 RepID=UPI0018DDC8E2|nr:hypothetical protein [Cupriavidus sp. USMAA2-4]